MKKWKSICAALIAVVLVGSLTACNSGGDFKDDPDKSVTLRLSSHNVGKADDGKVLTEINKRLETLLPNTKLEFVPQSPTNWQMWMSSKEAIDIAWTGFSYNMEDEIYKKSFLELDDLIKENAPNIQQEMQEYAADYDSGKYDGVQYMIPNQQPILNETRILKMPAELFEGGYMDVDALLKACHASPTTTEEVYQIIVYQN